MGLGILDDPYLIHVPGTTLFRDDPSAAALAQLTKDEKTGNERRIDLSKLKHAKGKHSHIVLVPQPSDDPNDPLNWPVWKKHLVCCSIFLYRRLHTTFFCSYWELWRELMTQLSEQFFFVLYVFFLWTF